VFRRFPKPEQADIDGARIVEANRQKLIRSDPDAARILTISATEALNSKRLFFRQTDEIVEYAKAKHAKGEMRLYKALFAGI
jgi:hypothetical protein